MTIKQFIKLFNEKYHENINESKVWFDGDLFTVYTDDGEAYFNKDIECIGFQED